MTTQAITLPIEGLNSINAFLLAREAAVPTDVRDKLIAFVGGGLPIDNVVNAAELIYARRDELPPELLEIGAQIAFMCANHDLYGMRRNGRGLALATTLRAMPGVSELVTAEAPEAVEPPEPLAQFRPDTEAPQMPAEGQPAG